jgi:hypothetical protein
MCNYVVAFCYASVSFVIYSLFLKYIGFFYGSHRGVANYETNKTDPYILAAFSISASGL